MPDESEDEQVSIDSPVTTTTTTHHNYPQPSRLAWPAMIAGGIGAAAGAAALAYALSSKPDQPTAQPIDPPESQQYKVILE